MIGALQQLKTMGVQVALIGFAVPVEDAAGLLFKNEVETVWRAISTYLIAQYLLIIRGLRKNPDLKELTTIFSNIEILNTAIVKRLRAASKKDSTVNALVHLDVFAKHFILALEESLESLHHIFAPFLLKYTYKE